MIGSRPDFLPRNHILRSLPPAELQSLLPYLARTRLVAGQVLYEAGEQISEVYFLENGVASVLATTTGMQDRVEIGLVGRDGMTGLPMLFGPAAVTFNSILIQIPGEAFRISADRLRTCLEAAPRLRRLLFENLETFMAQVAQIAACNGQHTLPARLARWLLMAHDRIDGDELPVTQDLIARMLAVGRPSLTLTMQSLEAKALVRHGRARTHILDRPGLEGAACACYERVRSFTASVAHRTPEVEEVV